MRRVAPAHPGTARGLITDEYGRWLIVIPLGGTRLWLLPGGLIEQDESPTDACEREIREEIGLDLKCVSLYSVGWNRPRLPGSRARYSFIFKMGVHDSRMLGGQIEIQDNEILRWKWASPKQALKILHPAIAERLIAAQSGAPTAHYFEAQLDAS
jgi:8-oxo-dGTP diphosphatase